MEREVSRLLDQFGVWLVGKDPLLPVVSLAEHRQDSAEEDTPLFGRVVSERRLTGDRRIPLPVSVSVDQVDLPLLRAVLGRRPRWKPGELADTVQKLIDAGAVPMEALPRVVPSLRAFLRFTAREHPDALGDVGVLALEDDLDDADVLVGFAMQLRHARGENPPDRALARVTRSRAIVTVDRYPLAEEFRLPLAARPAVADAVAREHAARSPGLAVLREVVDYVGAGRRATDSGNLTLADVGGVATRFDIDLRFVPLQSMYDVPAVAFGFRWAVESGFLVGTARRVRPTAAARLLTDDPGAACIAALRGLTHVPTRLLPPSRWRALPDEFAPGMLLPLLAVLDEYGEATVSELERLGWHRCTHTYDTASLSDRVSEMQRADVAGDVRRLFQRLALLGVAHVNEETVTLTALGTWAAQRLLPEAGYALAAGDLASPAGDPLATLLVARDTDEVRDVWTGLDDPDRRATLVEQLAALPAAYTLDVLVTIVGCEPDRAVSKAARRALFKLRCR